jgi:peptidyl-prolyl cis-trans isomerase C
MSATIASVAGVPLHAADETPDIFELRQRACTELLRQAAMREGLLDAADPAPEGGVISVAANAAIEALLAQALQVPEPDQNACRRTYAAQPSRWARGERARVRHVLFAVTPGVDVNALRRCAEACLVDVRAPSREEGDRFAAVAAETSNCPSGAQGGALGWLTARDCVPEFAREVFGHAEVGVLPRLVHSRFGLHVVEVQAREPGDVPPFETVAAAVAQVLRQQSWATALRQYLQILAAAAPVEGVDLDGALSPLVQ